jgi:Flp pilus assembly protein TadB
MRVSDADRAEVADRLAKHYADGRLDEAEFDRRLDQAMHAKTRADLIELLADLPENQPLRPESEPPLSRGARRQQRQILKVRLEREQLMLRRERREQRRREREYHWYSTRQLSVLVLVAGATFVVARMLRDIYSIWLAIAVLVFLWLRDTHRRRSQ